MKLQERYSCALCNIPDLEQLHTFTNFPVFMGCMDQPIQEDLRQDMSWWISRTSGLIQLKKLLPLDILYPESHGAGVVGSLWEKHHEFFAKFLKKFSPKSVLEIGGAHGILAKKYQSYSDIEWTILEPNPSPVAGCRANFIRGFFDNKFEFNIKIDAVVHSHVFEHIYDPNQFMQHLSSFMSEGQHLIFSLPNMQVMLDRKYTNCINFEHTIYLTEDYVEFLLALYGFKLVAREYFLEDHSIFYSAVRDTGVEKIKLPEGLYEKNKKMYIEYIRYHEKLIDSLNQRIKQSKKPVFLFGAHVFAQYLIAFGLDTSSIVSLLDNDPKKHGKRLYGTTLLVQSPRVLQEVPNAVVILKAGVYNDEIKADILENINSKVVFLE